MLAAPSVNPPFSTLGIAFSDDSMRSQAEMMAKKLSLPLIHAQQHCDAFLLLTPDHLSLVLKQFNFSPIFIDFIHGALEYRREYGGGKNQLIAKAVGIKSHEKPSIVDVTAGLGRDAFVLASLGCSVVMIERSPIIQALLEDGFQRAMCVPSFSKLSLKLIKEDAINYLLNISSENKPDVIYIDPMFPEKTKSALVKKEMRALRAIVGDDGDSEKLFDVAIKIAKKRVVVKRARLAPTLSSKKPDVVYMGKSCRFDVYIAPLT